MSTNLSLPVQEQLSIAETLRIMDVATEIRRQQELVESQFHADELKTKLREKLLAAAEVTGEEITEAQIEQAIEWYYQHLHKYKTPKPGFGLMLAHLYIRRGSILALTILLTIAGSSLYAGYWFISSWILPLFS